MGIFTPKVDNFTQTIITPWTVMARMFVGKNNY